jgi:hypothetical protein
MVRGGAFHPTHVQGLGVKSPRAVVESKPFECAQVPLDLLVLKGGCSSIGPWALPGFPQGTLYTAVLLAKQQNKWARAVELTLSPSKTVAVSSSLSSSMHVNPFGRLGDMKAMVRNITAQVVLKKLATTAPGQYTPSMEMALNELRIARRLNEDGGQKYTVVYIDSMQVRVPPQPALLSTALSSVLGARQPVRSTMIHGSASFCRTRWATFGWCYAACSPAATASA